jgi:tetratricopeptide (TPR) repeat protein
MEKGSELHRLVCSLDDRERRLYRRRLGQNRRNGKSNYLTLFNALAAMEAYDESALARKVDDPTVEAHLHSHQTRLFSHIVSFLREIEELPSVDAQLNAACEKVAILYDRGLFDSARKELRKAQQLALVHENYIQLLRMADLERSIFFLENTKQAAPLKEKRKFRDQEFLASLRSQVNLKLNHFEAQFLMKSGARDKQAVLAEVGATVQDYCGPSMKKTIRDAKASTTNLILLDSIGLISQLEGDFDMAYLAYSRMDSLWVSNPEMVSENASLYISCITRFLNGCMVMGRYNEFRNLLANLKTIRFPKEANAFLLKEALLYLEVIYCLNRGEYDKGMALVPEIEDVLVQHRGRIANSRVITFYFNLCSLHFMKGQYSKANRWLVQIINMPEQSHRLDIQQFAPVFQLLLFVAMDDAELLAARIRARRRAHGGEQPPPLEAAILGFAAHYIKAAPQEVQGLISGFRQSILDLIAESPVALIGAGECLFWSEGRLKGKTPGEIFKEYASRNNEG